VSKIQHKHRNNTSVDNFKLYGSTFLDATTIDFPVTATGVEILNCTFESCGDITVSTAITKYCNFISPNDAGVVVSSTSHNLSDSNFINCNHGIDFDTAGEFDITNVEFTNCTYDIEFSAASGNLIINNLGTSNASTYEITGSGSSVTINSPTTYTLTDLQTNSNVVLLKKSDNSVIDEVENSGTTFQYNYNWSGDIDIYVVVHNIDYNYIRFEDTLTNTNKSTKVFQQEDRWYDNP
jgi:hypothetical protein